MKEIHRYEFYSNGKIKSDNAVSYTYMAGIPVDSTITKEYYKYNSMGKIFSITNLTDSTKLIKSYNDLDSLISETKINVYGDTTYLSLTDYENGKVIKKSDRMLFVKLPKNFDNLKKEDLKNYDTLLFKTNFIYDGDLNTKSLSIDKNGKVTEETEYLYEGERQTKAITYSFLGDVKYVKQTTNFSTDDAKDPDYVTIGMQGDTIALKETIFKDDIRIVINSMIESNTQDFSYYNKKGQLIGTVLVYLNDKLKTVNSYTYDNKGNVIEEANYRERNNNAR